jgi:hypothetical protein
MGMLMLLEEEKNKMKVGKNSIKSLECWDNLEKILKTIIKENGGNFPSQKYLNQNGYSTVSSAISNYHDGFPNVREKMGYELVRKPNGYWNEKNTLEEAQKFLEENELKELPSHNKLVSLGYSDLAGAIQDNGGYSVIRDKLGQKDRQRNSGIWKNQEYVLEQAQLIMEEQGFDVLPSQKILNNLGYGSFVGGVSHHGGLNNVRRLLGEQVKETPNWKSLEYTLQKVEEFLEENNLNELPSVKKLTKMGYGALAKGIISHHNGMINFRNKIGMSQQITKKGTWNLENIIREAEKVKKELNVDTLPCGEILRKNGYSKLASAISKNYGFRNLRELLGEEQKKTENGLLKNFEYVKERILSLMQEQGWETLPSYDTFRKAGESGLASAIAKHHGGIWTFRKKNEKAQLRKPSNYWKDFDNIKEEALIIMQKLKTDTIPGSRFLNEHGYGSFLMAVQKYHGGIENVRERLN